MGSKYNQYTGIESLVGKVFWRLEVVRKDLNKKRTYWVCKCICGNLVSVRADGLKNGSSKSCGCWNNEVRVRNGEKNKTHGKSRTTIYRRWSSMIYRCHNSNATAFKYYGGRGITICRKWRKFEGFFEDMGDTWFEGGSIERKDVNGNYNSKNCIWIPKNEQNYNTRQNVIVLFEGKKIQLIKLCKRFGVKGSLARRRLSRGWTVEEALKGKIA